MAAGTQAVIIEMQTGEVEAALLEQAYAMGFLAAKKHERARRKVLREKRERKKYFLTQKLCGIATLIFTVFAVHLLDGDATVALLTVPLGITLIASKEMLIVNQYYWKCEDEKCNL